MGLPLGFEALLEKVFTDGNGVNLYWCAAVNRVWHEAALDSFQQQYGVTWEDQMEYGKQVQAAQAEKDAMQALVTCHAVLMDACREIEIVEGLKGVCNHGFHQRRAAFTTAGTTFGSTALHGMTLLFIGLRADEVEPFERLPMLAIFAPSLISVAAMMLLALCRGIYPICSECCMFRAYEAHRQIYEELVQVDASKYNRVSIEEESRLSRKIKELSDTPELSELSPDATELSFAQKVGRSLLDGYNEELQHSLQHSLTGAAITRRPITMPGVGSSNPPQFLTATQHRQTLMGNRPDQAERLGLHSPELQLGKMFSHLYLISGFIFGLFPALLLGLFIVKIDYYDVTFLGALSPVLLLCSVICLVPITEICGSRARAWKSFNCGGVWLTVAMMLFSLVFLVLLGLYLDGLTSLELWECFVPIYLIILGGFYLLMTNYDIRWELSHIRHCTGVLEFRTISVFLFFVGCLLFGSCLVVLSLVGSSLIRIPYTPFCCGLAPIPIGFGILASCFESTYGSHYYSQYKYNELV